MKFKEIKQLLTKYKWKLIRVKGSHCIFKNPNDVRLLIIPRHTGELNKKIMVGLLAKYNIMI